MLNVDFSACLSNANVSVVETQKLPCTPGLTVTNQGNKFTFGTMTDH